MNLKFLALLICALPAFGVISLVQVTATPVRTVATGNSQVTFASNSTGGNYLFAFCGSEEYLDGNILPPTDSGSRTWTEKAVFYGSIDSGIVVGVWQAPVGSTTGSPVTVTCNAGGSMGIVMAAAAEYLNTSTSENGENGATIDYPYSATTFDCNSVTTTVANNLILALLYYEAGTDTASVTVSTGFIIRATYAGAPTAGSNFLMADRIVSSTGTYNPVFTRATGDLAFGSCVVVAIQDVSQPAGGSRKRSGVF